MGELGPLYPCTSWQGEHGSLVCLMGLPWHAVRRGWRGGGDAVWLWGAAGWLQPAFLVPPAGRGLGHVSSTIAQALTASYTMALREQVVLVLARSPALSVCFSVSLSVSSVPLSFSFFVPGPVSTSLLFSLPLCSSLCPLASACLFLLFSFSPLPVYALVSVCLPVSCPCLNLCLQLARSVSAFPAPSHVLSFCEHSRCCVVWRCSLFTEAALTNSRPFHFLFLFLVPLACFARPPPVK